MHTIVSAGRQTESQPLLPNAVTARFVKSPSMAFAAPYDELIDELCSAPQVVTALSVLGAAERSAQ
jgi:hypothetical protein